MKVLNSEFNSETFFAKLSKGSLLMLDFDGTLAPFEKERMSVHLYPKIEPILLDLGKSRNTQVIIISGRPLQDLEVLLPSLTHIELWGSHGLERRLVSGEKKCATIDAKLREGLKLGQKVCLEGVAEEYCEVKPYAVALHWRGMGLSKKQAEISSIEAIWRILSAHYDLEIHPFDGGIELRPKGPNKGEVIRELLKDDLNQETIAYLGDDLTDEEAFAALGPKGLKVLVREKFRPTLADLFLSPPHELIAFLEKWKNYS